MGIEWMCMLAKDEREMEWKERWQDIILYTLYKQKQLVRELF